MIVKAQEVKRSECDVSIKGRWVPARPYSDDTLLDRIKQAYGVLTGKYDALNWEDS